MQLAGAVQLKPKQSACSHYTRVSNYSGNILIRASYTESIVHICAGVHLTLLASNKPIAQ